MKSDERKMHMTMKRKFMSAAADSNETCTTYSKSDSSNMIGNDLDEIIQELFNKLLHKYQIAGVEKFIKGSKFKIFKEYILYPIK